MKEKQKSINLLQDTVSAEESVIRKDELIKKRIIRAAFGQFSQYGIKSISMDYIARSISISKRTIYDYFSDKEELLIEGINYYNKRRTERLFSIYKETGSVLDTLLSFYFEIMENPYWYSRKFYDDLQRFPDAMRRLDEEKNAFSNECLHLFKEGVKEGVFLKDINYDIIALVVKENPAMLHPSSLYAGYSAVEVYDTILFTFFRGCCTGTGRAKLDALIAAGRNKI